MSETLERSQERLDNIQAIEPILGAMRAIAMGSWQTALKRRASLQIYRDEFRNIYRFVLPRIPKKTTGDEGPEPGVSNLVVLVIGSEQGLIGNFNRDLVAFSLEYLKKREGDQTRVKFWLLGSRLKRIFLQQKIQFNHFESLSTTSLPAFNAAADMVCQWLVCYDRFELDAVDVIYNSYLGASRYNIQVDRLIPFTKSYLKGSQSMVNWPYPIIETDPMRLFTQLIRQEMAIQLYEAMLASAASEHSTRYQLMEEASQNSEQLIDELTMDLQTIRRQAITREMQELAAGAGLLGKGDA